MHSEFSDNTILEVLNDFLALNRSKNAGGQSSAGEWSQNAPNHKRSHECNDDGESNSIGALNIPFQGMLTMPPAVRGQNFYGSARCFQNDFVTDHCALPVATNSDTSNVRFICPNYRSDPHC